MQVLHISTYWNESIIYGVIKSIRISLTWIPAILCDDNWTMVYYMHQNIILVILTILFHEQDGHENTDKVQPFIWKYLNSQNNYEEILSLSFKSIGGPY